jgi:hypothetical protein
MSLQRTNKGPKSPRFSLPEEGKDLKKAWNVRNLMDSIHQALASGLQGFLPSTEDVLNVMKEILLLAKQTLSVEHWDTQERTPEVIPGETNTDVEEYHIAVDPATGLPLLGSSEMGTPIPKVLAKVGQNYGMVDSKIRKIPRVWQAPLEPTELTSFLDGVLGLLVPFDWHMPQQRNLLRSAADALLALQQGLPEKAGSHSQGERRSVEPRLGDLNRTIASLANYARRQRKSRKR